MEVLILRNKVLYINITLRLRRLLDFIFYIAILLYGNMLMFFYAKENIGLRYGIVMVLSFLIMLFIMSMTMETIFITSDPINHINVMKYRIIFFLKVVGIIITYYFGVITNNEKETVLIYNSLIFVIGGIILGLHNNIINKYGNMSSGIIEEMISSYTRSGARETDVNLLWKRFVHFMIYCILQIFIYKYTLWRWEATIAFLIINIILLKRFFWQGCKDLYINYWGYFCSICLFSSIGIILMKLIYDQTIVLSIFRNRDEQELWMVFVLFYLPLMRVGKDLNRIKRNKSYVWEK